MSLFGDIDVANASDNPYYKEDGDYHCQLTGAEMKKSNKPGNPKGLALKYTILDGEKKGLSINEWKPIPYSWNLNGYETEEDEQNTANYDAKIAGDSARSLSYLKLRLIDFGFEPEKMNELEPKDFLELPEMMVTIKNKNDRENITGIELLDGKTDMGTSDPFSS